MAKRSRVPVNMECADVQRAEALVSRMTQVDMHRAAGIATRRRQYVLDQAMMAGLSVLEGKYRHLRPQEEPDRFDTDLTPEQEADLMRSMEGPE